MVKKLSSNPQEKIPSYVSVYNSLYANIMNDVYPEGESLPGETTLAKEHNVSRHVVRQALTILTEDGLIKKQQGKGSIVTRIKKNFQKEKELFNPMVEYAIEAIDYIDVHFNFAPPTDIAMTKLKMTPSELLLASNNVYRTDKGIAGHAFIQIPMAMLQIMDVDLNDRDAISQAINETIFTKAAHANAFIKVVQAESHVTKFLEVAEGTTLLFIEEVLHDEAYEPICRCKFYFIPEAYELNLWI